MARHQRPDGTIFVVCTPCRIRYSDIDGMKFVHHSKINDHFEDPRLVAMRKLMKLSYGKLEDKYNISQSIRFAYYDYFKALRFEDRCKVMSYLIVKESNRHYMTFYQEIFRGDSLLVKLTMRIAFFDRSSTNPVSLPEKIQENVRKTILALSS